MQETQEMRVLFLGQEGPPRGGDDNPNAYSSILAEKIPWAGEPGRL